MTEARGGGGCPLCGGAGRERRRREPEELARAYADYAGLPLTSALVEKYFRDTVVEYACGPCGLRWYTPARTGESDFYEHLSTFPAYYNPGAWDKATTVGWLVAEGCASFVDVGCGDGGVLREAARRGVRGFGVELNEASIRRARVEGLEVHGSGAPELAGRRPAALVSLQTLEHVTSPVAWLEEHLRRFAPQHVVLAVPAHDTLLGETRDPLVWPPHHVTLWSERALRQLAERVGFAVTLVRYEPNSWERFDRTLSREAGRRLGGRPAFPRGRIGRLLFRLLRRWGVPWVARAHTVLAVMHRKS